MATTSPTVPAIAVIGLGPRSIAVLERLVSHLTHLSDPPERLYLHLIDDAQHGGGRIWNIDQTHALVMNTFADGMTLFAEPGATVADPVTEGPTIYEWIRLVRGDETGIAPAKVDYFRAHPLLPQFRPVTEDFSAEELDAVLPHSYLPRALYGFYIQWVYSSVLDRLPDWVTPVAHAARAVGIRESGECDEIALSDATTLAATATVFVSGWQHQGFTEQEKWINAKLRKDPRLHWVRADNPIDQDVAGIAAGERVLVRGLGMGFFDVLALSTVERGGRFVEDAAAPGGLRYEASGDEPRFFASSRRGYPFLPQAADGQVPPPAAMPRLRKVIKALSARGGRHCIDYDTEVWPAVVRDAYATYVETLARVRPDALRHPVAEALAEIDAADINPRARFGGVEVLDRIVEESTDEPFSLVPYIEQIPRQFDSVAELTAWAAGRIAHDIAESERGQDSPVRAALWSVGSARKPTQVLGAEARYTAESRRNLFHTAVALGQFACSGPPLFRSRQLLALIEAGVVTLVGGSPVLDVDEGTWVLRSEYSASESVRGTTLVDAWVHKPDIRRLPSDPLMARLVSTGRVRPFSETRADGETLLTGSPELDPQTRLAVGVDGETDPRLHLVGIPAHSQYPDTTLAPPLPGTDSWFIQEADKAAVSALDRALRAVVAQPA